MATNAALRELLELAATNFGKRDQWVEDCLTLWLAIPVIHDASDAQMKAAMLHYLSTGKYAPRVADMVEALQMARPRVGPAPGGEADCADCGDTGWREGIAHFQEADGVRIEGPVALVCGCRTQRGVPYQDWLRQQEQRPGFIGHFHTGKKYPQIPDDWRLTPQQIARVAQLKAAKARPKGQVIAFSPQPVDHHARDRARLAKQAARMWNETEEEAV